MNDKDKIKIYLDNCCFNRPFDDQKYLSVKIETECKLWIQEVIKDNQFILCWSYILDFENEKNPFLERKNQIQEWKKIATEDIEENQNILNCAKNLIKIGLKPLDALHLSCADEMKVSYFITVDKGILKQKNKIQSIEILSPIEFVKLFEDLS